MLGPEQVGHVLGLLALVEAELDPRGRVQVEADRERPRVVGSCGRGDRGDRARVHAAAQVGPDRHVGDQLALDRLAEEPVELLQVLAGVAGLVGLREIEVPVALGSGPTASLRARMSAPRQAGAALLGTASGR